MRAEDKKLVKLFNELGPEQQETVLSFMEFLLTRNEGQTPKPVPPLNPLPRPDQESVIAAIKRLRSTYPMLDHGTLFHETSHHMTQHVMQGKPAPEVIDELEALFARHFEEVKGEKQE